ncbi:MAG: TauD/TfdA family dioxygenase [Gammaproteobacteria bacterium]|nr:MAG: TauD/TfdA family dioxygenase [Gammaproteobacteria bacterium]
MNTKLSIERLTVALGAEVRGMSLRNVDADQIETIKSLLLEHQVLFFPEQYLDIDTHVALGEHFGPLDAHPNLENPFTQHPQVFELAASHGGVADEWHSDISFSPEPAMMSILNMIECPAVGGDTMWANTTAAYDALSAPLRDLCDGLTALHDATPHGKPETNAIHPVVRAHPETGRKSLFVNEHFTRRIVELSHEESELLLGYLARWIAQPRFCVRYRWLKGAIAIWDNRCTQHFVVGDFGEQRIIQRVTVMGDKPESMEAPRWKPYTRQEVVGATSRYDQQLNEALGREVRTLESNRKPGAGS